MKKRILFSLLTACILSAHAVPLKPPKPAPEAPVHRRAIALLAVVLLTLHSQRRRPDLSRYWAKEHH